MKPILFNKENHRNRAYFVLYFPHVFVIISNFFTTFVSPVQGPGGPVRATHARETSRHWWTRRERALGENKDGLRRFRGDDIEDDGGFHAVKAQQKKRKKQQQQHLAPPPHFLLAHAGGCASWWGWMSWCGMCIVRKSEIPRTCH